MKRRTIFLGAMLLLGTIASAQEDAKLEKQNITGYFKQEAKISSIGKNESEKVEFTVAEASIYLTEKLKLTVDSNKDVYTKSNKSVWRNDSKLLYYHGPVLGDATLTQQFRWVHNATNGGAANDYMSYRPYIDISEYVPGAINFQLRPRLQRNLSRNKGKSVTKRTDNINLDLLTFWELPFGFYLEANSYLNVYSKGMEHKDKVEGKDGKKGTPERRDIIDSTGLSSEAYIYKTITITERLDFDLEFGYSTSFSSEKNDFAFTQGAESTYFLPQLTYTIPVKENINIFTKVQAEYAKNNHSFENVLGWDWTPSASIGFKATW